MNKKNDYKYLWKDDVLDKIKDVELNIEENNKIENLKEIINDNSFRRNNKFIKEIDIIYKLYKLGFSAREITDFSDDYFCQTGIRKILKEADLMRDKFESQKIGASKRNYGEIRNKAKNTLISRNSTYLGSTIEDYIRNKLDAILYELLLKDYEIIIGKNTMNILKQYENDIPIIIIINDKIYKFAIEFVGEYWHEDNKNDEIKDKLLLNKGYILYRINSKATITNDGIFKYQNDLNNKIDNIANKIKEYINLELKSCINNN
jgi:hypothetical protein